MGAFIESENHSTLWNFRILEGNAISPNESESVSKITKSNSQIEEEPDLFWQLLFFENEEYKRKKSPLGPWQIYKINVIFE